jgi:hypothetical protein
MKKRLLLLIIILVACKNYKDVDRVALLALNSKIRATDSLQSFMSLQVSKFKINDIRLCKNLSRCRSNEIYYKDYLKKINVQEEHFISLDAGLNKLQLIEYITFNNYSVFIIKGGAFGEFTGYLINNGKGHVPQSFRVNENMVVSVLDNLSEDIFYIGIN